MASSRLAWIRLARTSVSGGSDFPSPACLALSYGGIGLAIALAMRGTDYFAKRLKKLSSFHLGRAGSFATR
jgi:hypothetical protein